MQQLFDELLMRDIASWIDHIKGYTNVWKFREAARDIEALKEIYDGVNRIEMCMLEDILDKLLYCFYKFLTLLSPYATTEETLFIVGLDIDPCTTCVKGSRTMADFNNVTFMLPHTTLAQAHYFNMSGVFTADLPGNPWSHSTTVTSEFLRF